MNPAATKDVNAVLRARAEALAMVRPEGDAIGMRRMLLIFRLGQTRYALDPDVAREVWPVGTVARVPGHTPGLLGIINVRGRLVPLFDLAHVLQLPEREEAGAGLGIVAVHNRDEIGLRVDALEGILQVAPSDPSPVTDAPTACVESVLPDGALVFSAPALFDAVTKCASYTKPQTGGMS